MFATHQPLIGRFARENPVNWARAIRFAIVSAHRPLWQMPGEMRKIDLMGAEAASSATKQAGCEYTARYAPALFAACEERAESPYWQAGNAIVCHLAGRVPGLGIAKAGFAAQLIYGLSGCLDTHNLRRFNLSVRRWQWSSYKGCRPATRERNVAEYNSAVDGLGGTAWLWDDWCRYVAGLDPVAYPTADRASELHIESVMP